VVQAYLVWQFGDHNIRTIIFTAIKIQNTTSLMTFTYWTH